MTADGNLHIKIARYGRNRGLFRFVCYIVMFISSYATLYHLSNHVVFREDIQQDYYYMDDNVAFELTGNTTINPHDFEYTILEKQVCKSDSVYLLIMVCLSPRNFKHRIIIRKTWGSIVKTNKEVKLLFVLGNPRNSTVQSMVKAESDQYHDIIQEDFVDSYENLTLKSVALLKYAADYCNNTKYVLKIDDDVFINIPNLIKVLKYKNYNNSIIGTRFDRVRPILNNNSKWYTPKEMYSKQFYPPYTSGTNYVISGDIVSKLFNASLQINFFWLEDVFITGMCRQMIKAEVIHDYGMTYKKRRSTGCAYKDVISGHEHDLSEMENIWNELQNPELKCNAKKVCSLELFGVFNFGCRWI